MPLYFAYGSNMDVDAMRARSPGARPLGPARLARHRFGLMADGHATVARHPRADVHGVLFELTLADIPPLDRYEQVAKGLYAKASQPVIPAAGAARRALVYIGQAPIAAAPRVIPGYLEAIVAAAKAAGLPADYVKGLERIGPSAYVEAARPSAIKWRPKQGQGRD